MHWVDKAHSKQEFSSLLSEESITSFCRLFLDHEMWGSGEQKGQV